MDTNSDDQAPITIHIQPDLIELIPQNDSQNPVREQQLNTKQWLASNFRLTLGDLPCNRVTKIDGFSWKLALLKDEPGESLTSATSPVNATVTNLKVTIPMADFNLWYEWFQGFVIDGKDTDSDEYNGALKLTGAIELLSQEGDILGQIELNGVGISGLNIGKTKENEENLAQFTVELYVEQMNFNLKDTDI